MRKPFPPEKPIKQIVFTCQAPEARCVCVSGTFCDWRDGEFLLQKERDGTWRITLSLAPGIYEYRFLADGEWRDDPQCLHRVSNPFGGENCILEIT